jgi:hypothetical protein
MKVPPTKRQYVLADSRDDGSFYLLVRNRVVNLYPDRESAERDAEAVKAAHPHSYCSFFPYHLESGRVQRAIKILKLGMVEQCIEASNLEVPQQ